MSRYEKQREGYEGLAQVFGESPYSEKRVHVDPEALTLRSPQDHVDGVESLDEVEEVYGAEVGRQRRRGVVFVAAGAAALGEAYLNRRHGNIGEIARHALHIGEGVVLVKFAGALRNARWNRRVVEAAEEVEVRLKKQANKYPTEVPLMPDKLQEPAEEK